MTQLRLSINPLFGIFTFSQIFDPCWMLAGFPSRLDLSAKRNGLQVIISSKRHFYHPKPFLSAIGRRFSPPKMTPRDWLRPWL